MKASSTRNTGNNFSKQLEEKYQNMTFDFGVSEIKDDKATLKAPNGKASNLSAEQHRLVRTPAFKAWFGDWEEAYRTGNYDGVSKVLDENGEPLVLYHGTNIHFNIFDLNKTYRGGLGTGFYFTENKEKADAYGSFLKEVFLNVKNPILVTGSNSESDLRDILNLSSTATEKEIREKSIILNHDGVVKSSKRNKFSEICVFRPNQIKLADGSNTTFDSSNPDIRYADGGDIDYSDYKTAIVALQNEHGDFLILQRGSTAPWMPNKWSLVGGVVDAGEEPLDSAIREVKEEIGVDVSNLYFVTHQNTNDSGHLYFYKGKLPKGYKIELDYENQDFAWVNKHNYSSYDYVPHIKDFLELMTFVPDELPKFELGGIYHGSPHTFDKFSTDYMGSGEGVQAFGWGLYFTSLQDIARNYAEQLSKKSFKGTNTMSKEDVNKLSDKNITQSEFEEIRDRNIERITRILNNIPELERLGYIEKGKNPILAGYGKQLYDLDLNALLKAKSVNDVIATPNIYNVTLHKGKTPDQYTWLDWDEYPLSENVKSKIITAILKENPQETPFKNRTDLINEVKSAINTSVLYSILSMYAFSQKEASLFLLRAGFDGIKYTAESRSKGATSDNTRGFNYVVFDDSAITIEEVQRFAEGGQTETLIAPNEKSNPAKEFFTWYKNWYKPISGKMNIMFSVPNELHLEEFLAMITEENVVVMELFEKTDQNIDAKPYMRQICEKADELGITIYLEPNPRYKYFAENTEKRNKVSKQYLFDYYSNFGFEPTSDKRFMKRTPKMKAEIPNILFKKGGQINIDDYMLLTYHEIEGNWFVAKNEVYLWLYDDMDAGKKLQSGEYDYVLFPPTPPIGMAFKKNFVPPLLQVWTKKYQKEHKGSEKLMAVIRAWYDEKNHKLYLLMMTTRKDLQRKGIISSMIKELRKKFNVEQEDVIFDDPTEQGKSVMESKKFDKGGITNDKLYEVKSKFISVFTAGFSKGYGNYQGVILRIKDHIANWDNFYDYNLSWLERGEKPYLLSIVINDEYNEPLWYKYSQESENRIEDFISKHQDKYPDLKAKEFVFGADSNIEDIIWKIEYEVNKMNGSKKFDKGGEVESITFYTRTYADGTTQRFSVEDYEKNVLPTLPKDGKFHLGGETEILLAPNGKPSNLTPEQWHLVRTPEFKNWFGDWENDTENSSRVVDENGEPKVVFHGTRLEFTVFDKDKVSKNNKWGEGFYFTDNYEYAKGYANSRFSTIKHREPLMVFINVRDIYDIHKSTDRTEYVVKEPTDIKLADGSNTTFDPSNPDIRFDKGGSVDYKKLELERIAAKYKDFDFDLSGNAQKKVRLAPNGKPSKLNEVQYKAVRSANFINWFGDWQKAYKTGDYTNVSKCIDENGEPLIVYRGHSKHEADQYTKVFNYQVNRFSQNRNPNRFAFYFTESYYVANQYGGGDDEGIVTPYFLNIREMCDFTPSNPEYPNETEFYLPYADKYDKIWIESLVKIKEGKVTLANFKDEIPEAVISFFEKMQGRVTERNFEWFKTIIEKKTNYKMQEIVDENKKYYGSNATLKQVIKMIDPNMPLSIMDTNDTHYTNFLEDYFNKNYPVFFYFIHHISFLYWNLPENTDKTLKNEMVKRGLTGGKFLERTYAYNSPTGTEMVYFNFYPEDVKLADGSNYTFRPDVKDTDYGDGGMIMIYPD